MWYLKSRDISCSADSNDEATWQEELAMLAQMNVYWLNSAARDRATDFSLRIAEWAVFSQNIRLSDVSN